MQICKACEEQNLELGIKPKKSVSIVPIDPTNQKPVPLDQSIDKLMFGLVGSTVVVTGGSGFLMFGFRGLLVGSFIGLTIGLGLTSAFFR
ncbi:MAG: hypothetical protein AAFN77_21925 [Planctomycetota bacterium]